MSVKRKISVALVVVILILVGVVALVIWPTITDIRKISNAIYLERIDLEKKYLRGQLLRKTVDDFEKIKPERDRLNTIFLLTGSELPFITTLEHLAATNQLQEHTINLQPTRSGFFPLNLTIGGTFEQVMNYFTDLESLPEYYIVDNLQIATSRIEGSDLVKINLSGKIYSREPEKL